MNGFVLQEYKPDGQPLITTAANIPAGFGKFGKMDTLKEVKEAVGELVPVLLNTGGRSKNIQKYLSVADGVIVGSSLKVDGYTWNPVDAQRVHVFMDAVKAARQA